MMNNRLTPCTIFDILILAKRSGLLGFNKGFNPCYSDTVNRANAVLDVFCSQRNITADRLALLIRVDEPQAQVFLNGLLSLNLISYDKRLNVFNKKVA